jgi:hypothetical protein
MAKWIIFSKLSILVFTSFIVPWIKAEVVPSPLRSRILTPCKIAFLETPYELPPIVPATWVPIII